MTIYSRLDYSFSREVLRPAVKVESSGIHIKMIAFPWNRGTEIRYRDVTYRTAVGLLLYLNLLLVPWTMKTLTQNCLVRMAFACF
jgi:hypothetical protein